MESCIKNVNYFELFHTEMSDDNNVIWYISHTITPMIEDFINKMTDVSLQIVIILIIDDIDNVNLDIIKDSNIIRVMACMKPADMFNSIDVLDDELAWPTLIFCDDIIQSFPVGLMAKFFKWAESILSQKRGIMAVNVLGGMFMPDGYNDSHEQMAISLVETMFDRIDSRKYKVKVTNKTDLVNYKKILKRHFIIDFICHPDVGSRDTLTANEELIIYKQIEDLTQDKDDEIVFVENLYIADYDICGQTV